MDSSHAATLTLRDKRFRLRENLKTGNYVTILKRGLENRAAPRSLWEYAIVYQDFPWN